MSLCIDLSGEVALVTGGTRNIGLAIAEQLAAAGADVCIWGGSDQAALERALERLGAKSGTAIGKLVELASEAAIVAGFDEISARCGPVSILINNAAIRPYEPLISMSRDAWDEVIGLNLSSAFLTARELHRRLPTDRRGAIVNIGGISAHRPVEGRAHVIAAKAGLVGLTRALAAEGMGRIRANCVVPGAVVTERREGQRPPRFSGESEAPRGTPADVAAAVLPLADPSQQYVTGQTLHVSGGRYMS